MKETIIEGWVSLMRNRTRSLLTMLGIVWGLASVVLLLAYGNGLTKSVLSAFMGIGNNVIMIWPGQTSLQAGGQRAGKRVHFKLEDVQAVREEVPLLKAVSGETDFLIAIKTGTRVVSLQSKAVDYPYGGMRRLDIEEGRYFQETDFAEQRRVLILGPLAAKKVFAGAPAVGQSVAVNGLQFEVIGILRNKIQDSSNNGIDSSNAFLPLPTLPLIINQRDPGMIVFQPIDPAMHKAALAAVRAVVARRHHFDPKDDKATPEWDTIDDARELHIFTLALNLLLGLIGALTLGVGGVGVMNIMLVSVTERTREIGMRKALGARPRHLLIQFLTESLVLTFIGGIVGMIVAVVIAAIIPPMPLYSDFYQTANHEGDIFLRTSASVIFISFMVLSFVGVSSGFWPALKAARMNPIEALRYE